MTVYISNADYRRQKSALTRAVNSGDPDRIIKAVVKAVNEWHGKAWPDGWMRWQRAYDDAIMAKLRHGERVYGLPPYIEEL